MAQLLRDLIDIPERVHQSDFVLRLAEGVEQPAETLRDYVVTDQLVRSFGQALDLVRRAVEGRRSAGAYLHGSFGSGKSHFMAVLHLLLEHHPDALSIPQLAPVVAQLDWAEGKRFLLVPYHLVGAESLEQAILGGYVEHVRKHHPKAPLPAVFRAEPIFENAQSLRRDMGDEAFFAALNRGEPRSEGATGWGSFAAEAWHAASFAEAIAAPPHDERRGRLVSDLVARLLPAYRELAASSGEGYVTLDRGLAVLSRHAQTLGYQGLVLFLDELILWLASKFADLAFVAREGSKVAKLVESEATDRPVPIVSFIARQRDLRELLGDHLPGAERLSFSDTLKWSEGRFETISLDDRNLPAIASRRLLRPKNEEARQALDRAFDQTRSARADVLATLLGREGDPESFRAVYPFSPALVQTLVAISAVLQRERTALRVMLQLLVEQRDRLVVGDLVPLGALYDVIASGDEPFTEEMRVQFDHAKRLYLRKLRPMLERGHKLTGEELERLPASDPKAEAFRADDRLIKTLLLAALAPEVEALAGMTAARLAALNHGTIRSPIPGGEAKQVLARCRDWASQVGEIKIDESNPPTLTLSLSGVDTEGVLEKVRYLQDSPGNRKRALRELLFGAFGLPIDDQVILIHNFPWRGTKRQVEVVFGNIRELTLDSLRTRGEDWKIVVDFPFDVEGWRAADDIAKIEEFRSQEPDTATFCWVPAFFTHEAMRDLGTYVVLDYLLTGERFADAASHLSTNDRPVARALLDSQRSQLRQRLLGALETAYGVRMDGGGLVESGHELADRFQSLDRRFAPRPPAAASLREAFENLLDQLQSHRFPKHPRFELPIGSRDLKRVLEVARQAAHAPQGRIEVDRDQRAIVRQIANPLELGEMHEAAFVLGDRWRIQLTRGAGAAAEAGRAVTVGALRAAIDQPEPLGLPREVQDLLILTFAEQTGRSFYLHGGPAAPELGDLRDELELRERALPDEATWKSAGERAATIFGVASQPFRSGMNVASLRKELGKSAADERASANESASALRRWLEAFGVDPEAAPRQRTADALVALIEALSSEAGGGDRAIETIANASIATSAEAMARARVRAVGTAKALSGLSFNLLAGLREVGDQRQERAEALLGELRDALGRDELAVPLGPEIDRLTQGAVQLLAAPAPAPATPAPPTLTPPTDPPLAIPRAAGWKPIESGREEALDAAGVRNLAAKLEAALGAGGSGAGQRRLNLAWTLEERDGDG